eukprot:9447400-Pyramimonas_sp.AAC.1
MSYLFFLSVALGSCGNTYKQVHHRQHICVRGTALQVLRRATRHPDIRPRSSLTRWVVAL